MRGPGGNRLLVFTRGSHVLSRPLFEKGPLRRIHTTTPGGGYANTAFGTPYYYWSAAGRYLEVAPGFEISPSAVQLLDFGGHAARSEGATVGAPPAVYGPFWSTSGDQRLYMSTEVATYGVDRGEPIFVAITPAGQTRRLWPVGRGSVPSRVLCQLQGAFKPPDPAVRLHDNEKSYLTRFVQWNPQMNAIIYAGCSPHWQLINTRTGVRFDLPFGRTSPVSMSDTGLIAGSDRHGQIVVISVKHPAARTIVGAGYDPTWSRNGRWLFFGSKAIERTLRFRMQWEPNVPFKLPGFPRWYTVHSPLYRLSVLRANANALQHSQWLGSISGFAVANLNPVDNTGSIVFTLVPSDLNLWRHRKLGLTLAKVARYQPQMRVELASAGGVRTLVGHGAHLPAIQP
jgi:hypothetical protein